MMSVYKHKEKIKELMAKAIKASEADETEIVVMAGKEETTRFANSQIHQNVAEQNTEIIVRVLIDGKQGVAQDNRLEHITDALKRAYEIARAQEDKAPAGLPKPQRAKKINAFDKAVYDLSPARRAQLAGTVIKTAKKYRLSAAGALTSGGLEVFVQNSNGVDLSHRLSGIHLDTVFTGRRQGSGYAEGSSYKLDDFSVKEAAERAAKKALESEKRVDIEPGQYTVILEEPAVATLLSMLAYMGLSGKAVNEKRSFMCDNFNKKLVSESVTIYDDGLDKNTSPFPFDFEGVPKQKVFFFKDGVAKGVVYDTRTAAESGDKNVKSTGHALPAPTAAFGPFPLNIIMQAGKSSLKEMIASTERGLLVTRFHYARPVDAKKTIVTMMTRDGTFLIEDGKVMKSVIDLRVTQNILEALKNVEAISKERMRISGAEAIGSLYVPKLKIKVFNFTGKTTAEFQQAQQQGG